jgi:hypothetical protein
MATACKEFGIKDMPENKQIKWGKDFANVAVSFHEYRL